MRLVPSSLPNACRLGCGHDVWRGTTSGTFPGIPGIALPNIQHNRVGLAWAVCVFPGARHAHQWPRFLNSCCAEPQPECFGHQTPTTIGGVEWWLGFFSLLCSELASPCRACTSACCTTPKEASMSVKGTALWLAVTPGPARYGWCRACPRAPSRHFGVLWFSGHNFATRHPIEDRRTSP